MKTENNPTSKIKISSKPTKDRKGIMGTGKVFAYVSDTLFDDDLKKWQTVLISNERWTELTKACGIKRF